MARVREADLSGMLDLRVAHPCNARAAEREPLPPGDLAVLDAAARKIGSGIDFSGIGKAMGVSERSATAANGRQRSKRDL